MLGFVAHLLSAIKPKEKNVDEEEIDPVEESLVSGSTYGTPTSRPQSRISVASLHNESVDNICQFGVEALAWNEADESMDMDSIATGVGSDSFLSELGLIDIEVEENIVDLELDDNVEDDKIKRHLLKSKYVDILIEATAACDERKIEETLEDLRREEINIDERVVWSFYHRTAHQRGYQSPESFDNATNNAIEHELVPLTPLIRKIIEASPTLRAIHEFKLSTPSYYPSPSQIGTELLTPPEMRAELERLELATSELRKQFPRLSWGDDISESELDDLDL